MTLRPFEAHMYRVPDPQDTRIPDLEALVRELEAALLEANDTAARSNAASARVLHEAARAHKGGLDLPLNLTFAIEDWMLAGYPGLPVEQRP